MRSETITWPGGEHEFALPLGQLRALQNLCDAGPMEIFSRLSHGTWRVDDVIGTLRLGLEGGGMGKPEAVALVANTEATTPLAEMVMPALAVLALVLHGNEDAAPEGDDTSGEYDPDDDAKTGVADPT